MCVCACSHVCLCVERVEADDWCLPQSLSTLYIEAGALQLNPELAIWASLANQLALRILSLLCACMLGLKGGCQVHLVFTCSRDPNSSSHTYMASTLPTELSII